MDAPYAYIYIAMWATACLIAGGVYVYERESYALSRPVYWSFLFQPWKVVTFLLAATAMTIIAPYTGDPTWDYWDALFMSVLTFSTAPWVAGVLYKTVRKDLPAKQAFVAFCVWMFSASWSYDLYLLIRDGSYPQTWLPNIFASSFLYICGGLFWSLDWKPERGAFFSFMEDEWPATPSPHGFQKIIWYALAFMLLVGLMILPFLWS
jgi:hypothetical protein